MYITTLFWVIFFFKIFSMLTKGRCKSNTCLIGKTALISGGNSGIGLETAKALAARGCRIILADVADTTKTKNDIIKETNNPNIITKHCDFASFASVRDLAKDINSTEERLDILINNVGVGSNNILTEDKLSRILQVNYYSHFLLTHLLIDLLKKSKPSRIIFTSSILAFTANKFTIENLSLNASNKNKLQGSLHAYSQSKKLMIYATESLTKKLQHFGITVNCFHPGFVNTEIFQKAFNDEGNRLVKSMQIMTFGFGKTIEEGIQTLLYLALDKKFENVSGHFFVDCVKFFKPPGMGDRRFREDVWNLSEKIVKLEEHEKIT